MNNYLVCAMLRYDRRNKALVIPQLHISEFEAKYVTLASEAFHKEFGVLNPVLAVVNITFSTATDKLDITRSLQYLYGNTTYKHGK